MAPAQGLTRVGSFTTSSYRLCCPVLHRPLGRLSYAVLVAVDAVLLRRCPVTCWMSALISVLLIGLRIPCRMRRRRRLFRSRILRKVLDLACQAAEITSVAQVPAGFRRSG